eukprot:GHVP01038758.1.p1 GENE.GHVP01038758.1~~GHVP01038758.1.p1  ORF type:complete len:374 (-),score=57.98 GHVP01038758.1:50-1171(-)
MLEWFIIPVPISSGFGLVIQGGMNSSLSRTISDNFWPSAVTNLGGTIICFIVALFFKAPPLGTSVKQSIEAVQKKWNNFMMYFSGLFISIYLSSTVLAAPYLGFGLMFVGIVAGQIAMALIFELTGILWTRKRRVLWQKVVGLLLVALGTAVFQSKDFGTMTAMSYVSLAAACLGGATLVIASALTRKLCTFLSIPEKPLGGFYRAFTWAYATGFLLMALVSLINNATPNWHDVEESDWWQFFGGIPGFWAMTSNCIMPSYIGFAATAGWTILGQLVTSFIFDAVGMFETEPIAPSIARGVGMVVVLTGVFFVQWGNYAADRLQESKPDEKHEDSQVDNSDTDDTHTTISLSKELSTSIDVGTLDKADPEVEL